ncbi:hypothetical protein MATL_G00159450 [Megalops atlanticus]|uniref:Uncharacterized protein n=1 Tax=Megalops atlanticus TaxID=7932 RepID=A0A9D3T423_MEGAT|nr:hypothetical protein MATL_G00159450 [Megalops atlanticus]
MLPTGLNLISAARIRVASTGVAVMKSARATAKEHGVRVGKLLARVQLPGVTGGVTSTAQGAIREGGAKARVKASAAMISAVTTAKEGRVRLGTVMEQLQSHGSFSGVVSASRGAVRFSADEVTARYRAAAATVRESGERAGKLLAQLQSTAPASLFSPGMPPIVSVLGRSLALAAGAGIAITLVPVGLDALGFSSGEILTGAKAAAMMSSTASANGGGVTVGGLLAQLQSTGMAAGMTPAIPYLGTGLVLVTGAGVAVVAVPIVLGAVGFTSGGILAGSKAAAMMSAAAMANGGGVASGSLVAVLQSTGAAGLSTAGTLATSAVGSTLSWASLALYDTVMSQALL